MIELEYGSIKNKNMTNAIHKIGQYTGFAPKIAMSVANLIDEIAARESDVHKEWITLLKEHAVLDEKGDFLPKKNHDDKIIPNSFIPKDQDKLDIARDEFDKKTFTISADRIAMDDLKNVGLTPYEIKQLQPLIAEKILSLAK